MNLDDGGGLGEESAAFTFEASEPTVHEFIPGRPEQATRFLYTADASGVGFSLVVGQEALKSPNLIRTVAGQNAAAMNADAAVAGVVDIAETQDVKPLGSLDDVFQVAIESASGKSQVIITVRSIDMRPAVFSQIVAAQRATMATWEGSG